jgi:hypothetical protein
MLQPNTLQQGRYLIVESIGQGCKFATNLYS